jgi:hypothetical protein
VRIDHGQAGDFREPHACRVRSAFRVSADWRISAWAR